MISFAQFCGSVSFAGKMADNRDAEAIFDIMRSPACLTRMILLSEMGIPALAGCVREVVAYCRSRPDCQVDLSELAWRQMCGRFIKYILEDCRYRVVSQGARLPRSLGLDEKLFKTASVYAREPGAELDVSLRLDGGAEVRHVFRAGETVGV